MTCKLVARTRDEVRAAIDALPPETRALFSADYLAMLEKSSAQDPWVHGFHVLNDADVNVGVAMFKGPPREGAVEIAYAIVPEQQRNGYATDATRGLVAYAFAASEVHRVLAHTLPEGAISQRVLDKAGFRKVGEVVDPDDGLVWRFEIARP